MLVPSDACMGLVWAGGESERERERVLAGETDVLSGVTSGLHSFFAFLATKCLNLTSSSTIELGITSSVHS